MSRRARPEESYAKVPSWLLTSGVSSHAIAVYCNLADHVAGDSGEAFPGRRLLADRLGVKDRRTVDAAIRELEEVGAVTVDRSRWKTSNQRDTNLYTVHLKPAPPSASECTTPSASERTTPSTSERTALVRQDAQEEERVEEEPSNKNHQRDKDPALASRGADDRRGVFDAFLLTYSRDVRTMPINTEPADRLVKAGWTVEQMLECRRWLRANGMNDFPGDVEAVLRNIAELGHFGLGKNGREVPSWLGEAVAPDAPVGAAQQLPKGEGR